MGLFIVEGYNWGYGSTDYYIIEADTVEQANIKREEFLKSKTEIEKKHLGDGGDIIGCNPIEIKLNAEGFSQVLKHLW